jgi:hypothetical protein
MYFVAYFTDDGIPQSVLNDAKITIWRVDTQAKVVDDQSLINISTSGWFYYNYQTYTNTVPYVSQCDAGQTLTNDFERYPAGASRDDIELASLLPSVGTLSVQSDINGLNDPTPSEINAVITTAHGAGSYSGTSSTVINSIVNAQGLEIQSLINALNDPTPSEINAVITTAHGAGSYVGAGASQTIINEHNATQSMINALNNITSSAVNAVITTAHGAGSYVGAGASQTIVNKLDAIQTDTNTALPNLINGINDPTASAINAVITTAHGAGSYVGAGASQTIVNKLDAIQTDINASQGTGFVKDTHSLKNIQSDINALNDPTSSEINAVIETAHGAGSYAGTSSTVINSIVNAQGLEVQSLINALNDVSTSEVQSIVNAEGDEVQSLINALNDISTSEVQSIVNAQGLEVQSLINGLNDLSTSQVQSIINVHESNVQSDLNAMNTKLIRIEGQNGLYLVAKYTYNTSDINTKIEYWQYGNQTDMNNHQTINNVDKWQLDVTLTGQLADTIKFGEHA